MRCKVGYTLSRTQRQHVHAEDSTAEPMEGLQHQGLEAPALPSDKSLPPHESEAQRELKWGPAVDVNVRGLMASAVLAGQPVHIQLKNKQPVYLQGEICLLRLVCTSYLV